MITITRLFVIREQYKEQYEVISISHTIPMWKIRIKMMNYPEHSYRIKHLIFNLKNQKSFDLICTYSGFYNSIILNAKKFETALFVLIEMLIKTDNYINLKFCNLLYMKMLPL